MTHTERLQKLLKQSSLSESEQNEFYHILLYTDANALDTICELFEEDLSWIEWLYDNYRDKKEAFSSGDKERLDEILQDEIKVLE